MSDNPVLEATRRDAQGTRAVNRLRRAGHVPAVIYGHGEENLAVALPSHALELAFRSPSQIFVLQLEGSESPCLVKEVQYDTYGQDIMHVDFLRVDLSEEVEVEVEIEVFGEAKGQLEGGVIDVAQHQLSVACRADSIPDVIRIDVSELGIGDTIHEDDVVLPAGVRILGDANAIVVSCHEQVVVAAEEESAEGEEGVEGEGAEGAAEGEGAGEESKSEGDEDSSES